jgi:type II secretory pathway pseudopilin PulG
MLLQKLAKTYKQSAVPGFTLVEALISAAVFAVVITVIMDLALLFIKGPLQQLTQKQLEDEVSFSMDQMVQYIREAQIDYSHTADYSTQPTEMLWLTTQDNQSITLELVPVNQTTNTIQVSIMSINGTESYPLTGTDISIDALHFFLYPTTDPNQTTGTMAYTQPTVVVYIEAHMSDNAAISTTLQSAITSRYYAR